MSSRRRNCVEQFVVLLQRSAELFLKDIKKVAITMALPIVIAVIIIAVEDYDKVKTYEDTRALLFTIVSAAIYIGMFNSLTLICKERSIIKREYLTGMKLSSYVMANVVVQAFISLIQALVMTIMLYGLGETFLEGKGLESHPAFMFYMISMFLIVFTADMMGMFISSVVKTAEMANLIAPVIIIVQLIMSGVLFKLDGVMEKVASLTVSKWGMHSVGAIRDLSTLKMKITTTDDWKSINDDIADVNKAMNKDIDLNSLAAIPDSENKDYAATMGNLIDSWGALLLIIAICIILCIIFLRNTKKDQR